MKPTTVINDKDLLNVDQLADRLNLSPSRIRYEVFRRRIPYLKIGRSVRFRWDDVERWLNNLSVGRVQ